jgi:ketosteroid isomerase-like protein
MSREAALAQIAAARGRLACSRIEATVRAFQRSYAAKDWAGRAALLSKDVIFEDTVGVPPPAIGRAAAAEYFRLIIESGWIVEMEPEKIIIMGDEAFVLTRGAWGIAGDEPARLQLIHNFRFNDEGEIVHVRVAYDEGCLLD